jgi:hypothetical protein
MGYMFYYNLGGLLGNNKTGNPSAIGGEVLTGIHTVYWSDTEWSEAGGYALFFRFDDGGSPTGDQESDALFAWAVRDGDVAAAPEPASLLLLGVGALALGWTRRSGRRS